MGALLGAAAYSSVLHNTERNHLYLLRGNGAPAAWQSGGPVFTYLKSLLCQPFFSKIGVGSLILFFSLLPFNPLPCRFDLRCLLWVLALKLSLQRPMD